MNRRYLKVREFIIEKAIFITSFAAIAGIILIFIFIIREALPVLLDSETQKEANIKLFFLTRVWQPTSNIPKYSFIPLLIGTLKVTAVALFFAIPIAVGAAIYTAEFAPARIKELLKPVIEILAGIPSVVMGFFALIVLASFLQTIFGYHSRLNALNAGIALSFAIIPTIYSISEDALNAVPRSYREASYALGANRWQTAYLVVLPAAAAGVLASVILGLGRAIGETMIVLMASGNAAIISASPLESVRVMSATIAAELAEVVFGSPHYNTLFFIGALLLMITMFNNVIATVFVNRLRRSLEGKR